MSVLAGIKSITDSLEASGAIQGIEDINTAEQSVATQQLRAALMQAVIQNDRVKVADCLAKGANASWAIMTCVRSTSEDQVQILDLLLKAKANLSLVDKAGRNPLMHCLLCLEVDREFEQSVKALTAMAKLMIEKADLALLQMTDKSGNTAMHLAASAASIEVCALLAKKGCSIDSLTFDGTLPQSPLHAAIKSESDAMCMWFIEQGVTLSMGPQARAAYEANRKPNSVNPCVDPYADLLRLSARRGLPRITRTLIDAGIDANSADNRGRTALHNASQCGHFDAIRLLVVNGRVNVNAADSLLVTPLHLAAARDLHGHLICSLLIDLGANPDARDKKDETPKDFARSRGHLDVVAFLDASSARCAIDRMCDQGASAPVALKT